MDAKLEIIIPVFNEEDCIEQVIRDVHSSVLARIAGARLLVVNDGSNDATPEILDRLAAEFPSLFVMHKKNGGHGDALLYGLARARGEYLFIMDSDGQVDPDDFWLLWEKRREAKLVCGYRSKRNDPLHRLFLSRLLRHGNRLLFGKSCSDANVPFKLMTRGFWEGARRHIPNKSLTPSLLLPLYACRAGAAVAEIEIRHLPRKTGTCHIRYFRLLVFCLHAFVQLLAFRWRLVGVGRYSRKDLEDA